MRWRPHKANAAEKAGLKKLIYTSPTAAMGPLRDGMDESAQLLSGILYGATKDASEMYLMGFKFILQWSGRERNENQEL